MELIESETDERMILTRITDRVRNKMEDYHFNKRSEDEWELVAYTDDDGGDHYPPKIPDAVKDEVEDRFDVTVSVADNIYAGTCNGCNATLLVDRVEMEEDGYGYMQPATDTITGECPLCEEEQTADIEKAGMVRYH